MKKLLSALLFLCSFSSVNAQDISLPPKNPVELDKKIQEGLQALFDEAIKVADVSYQRMRKGTAVTRGDNAVYDVADQIRLPNIKRARLYVAQNSNGSHGLTVWIDPAITTYYLKAFQGLTTAPKLLSMSDDSETGKVIKVFKHLSVNENIAVLIDYEDEEQEDMISFLAVKE